MTDYVGSILGYRTNSSAFGSNVSRSLNGSNSSQGSGTYRRALSSANINRIATDWEAGYSPNISRINLYIEQGYIDEALREYNSLFSEVEKNAKLYNSEIDDSQIASAIAKAYQRQTGKSITEKIDECTSSPFVTGLKNGIPILHLFSDVDSNADTLAKLSGTEAPKKATRDECIGGAISGTISGAAVGAGVGVGLGSALLTGVKVGGLAGGPLGAVIGAVVGAIGFGIYGYLRGKQ